MFGLLREVIGTYEVGAFDAWQELERAVSGKRVRFLTWSKGAQAIRARAGHARVVTDDEIAATDLGSDDLIVIDPEDWPRLRVVLEVLFRVGEDGLPAATAWLTAHGIGWTWATTRASVIAPATATSAGTRTEPGRPMGREAATVSVLSGRRPSDTARAPQQTAPA